MTINSNKTWIVLLAVMFLQLTVAPVKGFVLMGPPNTSVPAAIGGGQVAQFNFTDDMGAPQPIKEFFRWNIPSLTYSFDASFVQYFGLEGIAAVNEAVNVVNNFFINDEYSGVSSMDLARHGFLSNYNSHSINVTAQNRQIIDIKSLVLGMLVNHLGLGNPHRYAYSIYGTNISASGTQVNFNVSNRNFDPLTLQPTGAINNVTYSYRLIHDQTAGLPVAGALALPTLMDMEEFTSDTSGNAWSTIASIPDSFYGNTALFWTDIPTLFGFGSFYHNDYAVGGANEPRHTLTYDDAGGLKYLYRTNNYVFEFLDGSVSVVSPARFVPDNVASQFPSQSASVFGLFPRRNIAGTPLAAPTSSTISREAFNPNPTFVFAGFRGGIDSVQFYYQPFDSLLGIFPVATNQFWTDTFINTNGVNVLNVSTGSSYLGAPNMAFFTQRVGRTVTQPDFIFSAEDLGLSVDGVPIAWDRSPGAGNYFSAAIDNQGWVALNLGTIQGITNSGPGIITMSDPAGGGASNPIVYRFSRTLDGFEVLWSGEPSVLGNTTPYSLWGYIFGPGSADLITFPNNLTFTILENAIAPAVAIPTLSMASDDGGLSPILPASLDRTEESLTLLGNNLASVLQIEIIDATTSNLVQTISSTGLIISDQKITIPPGVVNYISENTTASTRKVRVRNSVGVSTPAPQAFGITTGKPKVTGTSADGETFNRAGTLTVFGYGFKATSAGTTALTHIRVEDSAGNSIWPNNASISVTGTFTVVSDTEAVLSVDQITSAADGANRRIRVARGSAVTDLSLGTNPLFSNITSTPTITVLGLTSSQFRRDASIDINGTGFVTATKIELLKEDGAAFSPTVVLNLPAAGVSVNANGTSITIAANAFTTASADGNGSNFLRRFRVYNEIGYQTSSVATAFNVNIQPTVISIAGFSTQHPTAFDRSQATGDDITITGTGLLGATEIQMVDETGTALGSATTRPRITLPVNGVTVTDTSITIDTQTITFADGQNADSNGTSGSRYRRFQVVSSRTAATSPISQRFDVAIAPTFTSLTGTGYTSGIQAFERNGTFIFTGANLGFMTKIEIVDASGNVITGVTAIDQTTLTALGGTFTSTVVTVTGDDFTQGFLIDSVGNSTRRVKVSNPVGSVVSLNNGSGHFSVSNLPTFSASNSAIFAGTNSGFDGNNTYQNAFQDGSLWINSTSSNMRGVKTITFGSAGVTVASGAISVDAVAPPAGISFSADGTRIIIAKTAVPAAWYASLANGTIILTTAANRNATIINITTLP